jgi:Zn-dependent protease with chaperone function
MNSPEEPGWLARIFAVGWTFFATLAFVVCLVAGAWSWCGRRPTADSPNVRTDLADPGNARHEVILRSLKRVWGVAGRAEQKPRLAIADSKDINAASFGDGTFLFWDGVADLPASEIDAIAAHEVAHDHLRHSKKAAELRDVTQFFSQLIGIVGGASDEGQRIVSDLPPFTGPKLVRVRCHSVFAAAGRRAA